MKKIQISCTGKRHGSFLSISDFLKSSGYLIATILSVHIIVYGNVASSESTVFIIQNYCYYCINVAFARKIDSGDQNHLVTNCEVVLFCRGDTTRHHRYHSNELLSSDLRYEFFVKTNAYSTSLNK